MKKFLNYIDIILLSISALLFCSIFVISIIEILLREIFGRSLFWTIDLCTMLASWMILLAGAVGIHRNEHLIVDFLVNKLPKKTRLLVKLIAQIILLSIIVILTYNGLIVSQVKMGLYYTTLHCPTGYAFIALPIFGFFSILFIIEKIIDIYKSLTNKAV